MPFASFSTWLQPGLGLELFDGTAAELRQLVETVGPERAEQALGFAVRAAAFDTGAIEGLYSTNRDVTFSVAEQTAAWEAMAAREAGRDAVRHFRAQLAAFDLVLDAVTGVTPVTAAWLRALHETVSGGQDTYRALTAVGWQDVPLPKGEFKRWPNHVREADGSWRSYAPPDRTPVEVQRLVDEIAAREFADAHPVVQAAFVHHALVWIHPFADGNGRVARALGSVFLYRAARVPLHIWADQRGRYLDALRATDSGDTAAFIRFVRDVSVDTIRLVVLRLRPVARRAVPALSRRRTVSIRISDRADDALIGSRVLTAVADRVGSQLASGAVEMVGTERVPAIPSVPAGFETRPVSATPGAVRVAIDDSARRVALVTVVRAVAPGSPYDFALIGDGVPPLPLRRDQLDPAMAEVTAAQIAAWVDDLVDRLATDDHERMA